MKAFNIDQIFQLFLKSLRSLEIVNDEEETTNMTGVGVGVKKKMSHELNVEFQNRFGYYATISLQ